MKKLSKFLAILIALVSMCTFCLVGCNNGEQESESKYKFVEEIDGMSTQEVYTQIMSDVNANRNNFTATVDYTIPCKTTVSGVSIDMNMRTTSVMKMNGDDIYEYVYLNTGDVTVPGAGTMPGEEIITETWLVDNMAYLSAEGEKYKYDTSLEALAAYLDKEIEELYNPIYNFSDTAFEDVKFAVNKKDSSDVYFELILSGDDAADFAKDTLESLEDYEDSQVSFGKITYRFIITEEGALENIEVKFNVNVSVTEQGMTMKMNFKFNGTISFSDVGTTVVNAPTDANAYYYLGSLPGYTPPTVQ